MKFNLTNDIDIARFRTRVEYHLRKQTPNVELTEKRTKKQNSYLHLIIGWFAIESGNTIDFVKRNYYKKAANSQTFLLEKEDKFLGKVEELRSSADLTSGEMTLSIERFRNWAAQQAGIYLPDANEDKFLEYIRTELYTYEQWI
jgi:hypothetical protein